MKSKWSISGWGVSQRGSSRRRIGLAFAVLAGAFFVGAGLLSSRQAFRQVEDDQGRALTQVAAHLSSALDAGLVERMREIQNLAAFEPLAGRLDEPDHWRAAIERLQASFPHYAWIGVASPDGRVLASTGGVLLGADVGARPWFAQGQRTPFSGDVHEAVLLASLLPPTSDGEPLRLVDFSAPVRQRGALVAVLGAHLSWNWAAALRAEVLGAVPGRPGLELSIVDAQGRTLLGPRQARTHVEPVGGTAALVAQGPGVVEWTDGERHLSAAVRSRLADAPAGFGWTVLARQPVDEATRAASTLALQIWSTTLAAAVVFGVAAWWLAGRLTARLRSVAAQARSLAPAAAPAGPRRGDDEVAELSSSLGALDAALRARERELLRWRDTLEARVSSRTSALSRANEDLQSFNRTVAHDLKGPIAAMGGIVRLLASENEQRAANGSRELLNLMGDECDRLLQLVDGLMTLAQVEQRPIVPAAVDMAALVADVRAELQRAGADAGIEWHVGVLPPAHGDAVLLRQAWRNLLGNAVKFSAQASPPRVAVDARVEGGEAVYRVRDNGVGFDPAAAARLFGAFERLHDDTAYPGHGVGLSIVRRVVERHGGRVWAEAPAGGGALFCFALPCEAPPAA